MHQQEIRIHREMRRQRHIVAWTHKEKFEGVITTVNMRLID